MIGSYIHIHLLKTKGEPIIVTKRRAFKLLNIYNMRELEQTAPLPQAIRNSGDSDDYFERVQNHLQKVKARSLMDNPFHKKCNEITKATHAFRRPTGVVKGERTIKKVKTPLLSHTQQRSYLVVKGDMMTCYADTDKYPSAE